MDDGGANHRAPGSGTQMIAPIRIQFVQTNYPHWGKHSGFHQYIRYLDREKFVSQLRRSSDTDQDFPLPHAGLRQQLKRRVQKKGMKWYKLSDLWAELAVLPGCLLSRTQIVHFLDGEHGVQFLPVWLKKINRTRTKIVASYHQPAELLETLIDPELIAELDHVNLVSPTQADYFLQFLPPERISVVLHGIDTEFFRPGQPSKERKIFRCITVGHHLRDWQTIAAVADKLKVERDVEFHIITSHLTGLEDFNNVIIHRNVADDTLLANYQQSDVLFMPLTDSTANNAILEGIACGLPVISTKLRSVEAYLPGDEALLIENNEPELLADALLKLRKDSEARLKMGLQARRRAEELSWSRCAPEYEKVYSGLCNS